MINIPRSWWIGIGVFGMILTLAMMIFAIIYVSQDDDIFTNEGGTRQTPTILRSQQGPTIGLGQLPRSVEVGVPIPIRIEARDEAGLIAVTLYQESQIIHDPSVLEGQQVFQTTFQWRPNFPAEDIEFEVRVESIDGRISRERFFITVIERTTSEEIILEYILQPDTDPFAVAQGFGVCFDELEDANGDNFAEIEVGDPIYIPYRPATGDEPARECEEPPENYFRNLTAVEDFARRTTVYPTGKPFVLARGFGCHTFFTGYPDSPRCADQPEDRRNFHTGADFVISQGQPITSVTAGTVIRAGPDTVSNADCSNFKGSDEPHNGYGNYVVIERGNTKYYYAHLSEITVEVGQYIEDSGYLIGYGGSTGCSTAPHLHFEVREGTKFLDPMEHLRELEQENLVFLPTSLQQP